MIECAITSSVLIAIVLALRFLFWGKIGRRLQYALWGLVLLRLLLPLSLFGSALSVMNALPANLPVSAQSVNEAPVSPGGAADPGNTADPLNATSPGPAPAMSGSDVAGLIWLIGAVAAGGWVVGTNLAFGRRLVRSRQAYQVSGCKLPVYVTDQVASPCLSGIFRPAIYLTRRATESDESVRHVLAHELCHHRHGDHVWSALRGLCLAGWWWNPLVWAAAIFSREDSELACDEAVIKQIGTENRLAYGRTLVDMVAMKTSSDGLVCAATTMISGSRGIKERLNMIISNPRTLVPALIIVLLIAAIGALSTFTGARAARLSTGLSAAEALQQLAASVLHGDGQVSFRIPREYEQPRDWNILVAGRSETDGFSRSVHLLTDVNDAKAWEPGKSYTIPLNDNYTELTLTAFLPGADGSPLETSVNLLPQSAATASYGLMHLGAGGRVLGATSPLTGDAAQLAEGTIMNYMLKSAAWPGTDPNKLGECYLVRTTYADGTVADYYAYLIDGHAVMQRGADGYYSRIDDALYDRLVKLAATAGAGIEQLLATIELSPAYASNPGTYIDAHPEEYGQLLSYGDYTLRYVYGQFLAGGQTDLRGHIMLAAMRELLGSEDVQLLAPAGTAQAWFDEWRAHAVQLREANSPQFMEQNYPKTYMMLQMLAERGD